MSSFLTREKTLSVLKIYLLGLSLSTIFCGLVYLTVQQDIRLSANDPQLQRSEDIANTLSSGQSVQTFTYSNKVDLAKSLTPFVIIFDNEGKVLSSSAILDNQTPIPPPGVFDYTRQHSQNKFTWQPKNRVRIATVITRFNSESQSGFVLTGRSLREVEIRENQLLVEVALAWVASILTVLIIPIFPNLLKKILH